VNTEIVTPMTRVMATKFMTRLMGSYPAPSLDDPKTYAAELVLMFIRYPEWVGEQAVVVARQTCPKFVPSVAEVEAACEAVFSQTRIAMTYAQQWDARSAEQLEERAAIEAEEVAEPPEQRAVVADRIRRELAETFKPVPVPTVVKQAVRWPWQDEDEA
jgi:hypothetical protein